MLGPVVTLHLPTKPEVVDTDGDSHWLSDYYVSHSGDMVYNTFRRRTQGYNLGKFLLDHGIYH